MFILCVHTFYTVQNPMTDIMEDVSKKHEVALTSSGDPGLLSSSVKTLISVPSAVPTGNA